MTGNAFTKSGHLLDSMKICDRIRCAGFGDMNSEFNTTLDLYTKTVSQMMDTWTFHQLKLCYRRFINPDITLTVLTEEVSSEPGWNTLTVQKLSQALMGAHYKLIMEINAHFKTIVASLC